MRILFVMPTHISYGGIESVAISLWREFLKRGHFVDFVCHGKQKGIYEETILESESRIYHITVKGENYRKTIREFTEILKREKYDVVHAHMNATSGIYLKIAKQYGVKARVAHSHASSMSAFTTNPLKIVINNLEKIRTNMYANVKIACSDQAGKWLFGNRAYVIVLNAVEVSKFLFSKDVRDKKREELRLHEEEFIVLHVGDFIKCKNHLELINIFCKIKKLKKDAKLILVGEGPLKMQIKAKISECGISDSVVMLGKRNDVSALMQAADVFLLPSISEGNPVVLMEAAVAGLHCVVSDHVAHDIAEYFDPNCIEYLPLRRGDEKERWAERTVVPWERIQFSDTNPCKIDATNMAVQVELLYKESINNGNVRSKC